MPYLFDLLDNGLLWLGVALFAIFAGLPVVIRLTFRHSADPEFMPFMLEDSALPERVAGFFSEVTALLRTEGFELIQPLCMPAPTNNVRAFFVMYAHRANKDVALASVFQGHHAHVTQMWVNSVEIESRFRDQTSLLTSNSTQVPSFPPAPGCTRMRLPMVRQPSLLYRYHTAHLKRMGNVAEKFSRLDEECDGLAAKYIAEDMLAGLNRQVASGYLYPSEQGQCYRMTWKGAILLTWRQLWPFKLLLRALDNRRARKKLAELENVS